MKLIFSRKGFDSSSGGCPSPLFPDGSLYSIPIPDQASSIPYSKLHVNGIRTSRLISDLTRKSKRTGQFAHLDPDLSRSAYPRRRGWKPILGQTGSAQGHLTNQNVRAGDLFLFFGLFRPVEKVDKAWRFIKQQPAKHIIWGWLQTGDIIKVDSLTSNELPWARYHPHFHGSKDSNNALYIASEHLTLPGTDAVNKPGAGIFPVFKDNLQLTSPQATSTGQWQLPALFYPSRGKPPLSYHAKKERWKLSGDYCLLRSVSRGQEFVLDTKFYPGIIDWIGHLLK